MPAAGNRSFLHLTNRLYIALAALLMLTIGALAADSAEIKLGEFIPAASLQPAPALSVTDLDGKEVALADIKGKLVLVNLWATWCQPCLREMPSLERLQTNLGDGLIVVAISQDHGGAKTVEPFLGKLGLDNVKTYLDPKSKASHAFDVRGLPTSILIDGDGKVLGKVEGGADWDSDKMRAVVKKFLPANSG
jgi:thiol-disulfide isomerase/thioredoxin